jgi:hypothetical protein
LIVFQFSCDTGLPYCDENYENRLASHSACLFFSLLLSERPFRLIEWLGLKLLSRTDVGEVRGAKEKLGWAHQHRITLGSCEKPTSIYTSRTIHEKNWKINRQLIPPSLPQPLRPRSATLFPSTQQ